MCEVMLSKRLHLLLTKKCNQTCYYCRNYSNNSVYTEVDIDYLKWILSIYFTYVDCLNITLTGGEPGLITNIDDIFNLMISTPQIHKVLTLSNGLIRKQYNVQNILQNKFEGYDEHFCLEIRDKDILFFYPELPFYDVEDWIRFILVLSDTTLNSILKNFKYYEKLYHLNMRWKAINFNFSKSYLFKLEMFYKKLLQYNPNITIDQYRIEKYNKYKNTLSYQQCASNISNCFIDIENKQIGMCCVQVDTSPTYLISKTNIEKAIFNKLFTHNNICQNCDRIVVE